MRKYFGRGAAESPEEFGIPATQITIEAHLPTLFQEVARLSRILSEQTLVIGVVVIHTPGVVHGKPLLS